jgi:hypothetical protein
VLAAQWKEHDCTRAPSRCGAEAKRAVAGENQREIAFALTSMTSKFLHMGFVSRRIPDIWQVITRRKMQKKINSGPKMQENVILYA